MVHMTYMVVVVDAPSQVLIHNTAAVALWELPRVVVQMLALQVRVHVCV